MNCSLNKNVVLSWIKCISASPVDIAGAAALMGSTFTTTHLGQPGFSGAPLDFLHYLASLIPEGSKMTIEPKRIVEEGDQVWVWSVVKGAGPNDKQSVDIVTLKDGKIVENHDVQNDL